MPYSYNPNLSGDTLTITNNGKEPMVLDGVMFVSSANIDTSKVNGTMLMPPGITKTANPDGTYTYQIGALSGEVCNNCLTIPVGGSAYLSNILGAADGQLPVRMDPASVRIHNYGTAPGEWQGLDIANHCVDKDCDNPHEGIRGFGYINSQDISNGYNLEDLAGHKIDRPVFVGGIQFNPSTGALSLASAADGTNLANFSLLRKRYPYMEGGLHPAGDFNALVNNQAAQQNFINNIMLACKTLQMDMVQVDLRQITVTNAHQYKVFMSALKTAANAKGIKVSSFWPQDANTIEAIDRIDSSYWESLYNSTDYATPMTVGYNQVPGRSGLYAPLYASDGTGTLPDASINTTMSAYESILGTDRMDRLHMMVPVGGYRYALNGTDNEGLNQLLANSNVAVCSESAIHQGGLCSDGRPAVSNHSTFFEPGHGDAIADKADASWGFNPVTRDYLTVDTDRVLDDKGGFRRDHRIGGIGLYNLALDAAPGSQFAVSDRVLGLSGPGPGPSNHDRLGAGAIAGIVAGGLAAIAALAFVAHRCRRRHQARHAADGAPYTAVSGEGSAATTSAPWYASLDPRNWGRATTTTTSAVSGPAATV